MELTSMSEISPLWGIFEAPVLVHIKKLIGQSRGVSLS